MAFELGNSTDYGIDEGSTSGSDDKPKNGFDFNSIVGLVGGLFGGNKTSTSTQDKAIIQAEIERQRAAENRIYIVIGIIVLVFIGVLVFWIMKKKKNGANIP